MKGIRFYAVILIVMLMSCASSSGQQSVSNPQSGGGFGQKSVYNAQSGARAGQKSVYDAQSQEFADAVEAQGIRSDSFTTPKGRNLTIYFIKHASLIFDIDGYMIYVDPVTIYGNDFTDFPKADMILVTHSHHDHLDPKAIEEIAKADTVMYGGGDVSQKDPRFKAVVPGETITDNAADISFTTTPAYNTTPDHLQFHPKARKDVGYILDIDGMRIYVAGDTEGIPEMADLGKIDIAFLPVNQPYTMTPAEAIHAAEMVHPAILYPYHYGDTNLSSIVDYFKAHPGIDVRIRQME